MVHIQKDERVHELEREMDILKKEFSNFVYIVSHDFNTPLRNIYNFSKIITDRYNNVLDEKGQKFLHHVIDAGQKAQDMMRGLLEYSRINTRQDMITDVDVNKVIKMCISSLEWHIAHSKAEIKFEELPVIKTDAAKFHRIMYHLLDNAIKFSRKDITPIIYVSAAQEEKKWIFVVSDNGIGIDPKYHTKIFDMFFRLNSDNDGYSGVGSGLAVCQKTLEHFKGKIWVESELGKGTNFHFTLPINVGANL